MHSYMGQLQPFVPKEQSCTELVLFEAAHALRNQCAEGHKMGMSQDNAVGLGFDREDFREISCVRKCGKPLNACPGCLVSSAQLCAAEEMTNMSFAWEGADRLSGGSGDLSESFARELSEPITQRIVQLDKLAPLWPMQHAVPSLWPEGDLTTTNVITAIMQASFLHMALHSQCRAVCSSLWEALRLARNVMAAQQCGRNTGTLPMHVQWLGQPSVSKPCWSSHTT